MPKHISIPTVQENLETLSLHKHSSGAQLAYVMGYTDAIKSVLDASHNGQEFFVKWVEERRHELGKLQVSLLAASLTELAVDTLASPDLAPSNPLATAGTSPSRN